MERDNNKNKSLSKLIERTLKVTHSRANHHRVHLRSGARWQRVDDQIDGQPTTTGAEENLDLETCRLPLTPGDVGH